MEDLVKAVDNLPNDSLSSTRKAALNDFNKFGLPTTKDEDWKYTDLSRVSEISNRWLAEGALQNTCDPSDETINSLINSIEANWLIIANGIIDTQYFINDKNIDIKKYSETNAPSVLNRPLSFLNAALMQDGLKIYIHKPTIKPIGLLILDNTKTNTSLSQVNIDIEVASDCKAEIIEYHHSIGKGDHYSNSVATLKINEGASTHYTKIQDRQINHTQTTHTAIDLKKNSILNMACYDIGGGLIRNDIDINIDEPGVDASLNGLYLTGENQHIDNHIKVEHRVGPASSSQEFRGILNGNNCSVWNGKAIVHEGADGTDANQKNHNLLLSEKAEINTKPELVIYADDVKCSHGATVGQLDESAIFYLRTRGLSTKQATEIITQAFAADLVDRTPISQIKNTVSSLVASRLAKLIMDH
tara:strand:- start:1101 stop:2348 length:1248 start_codon:yes stop_codon:yes gene_type:complete